MGRTIPALPKEFTEWSQRTALTGYNLPQEIMETIEKKHWEKTLRTMYSRAFHGLSLTFQGLSRSFHVYCIKLQFYQSWPASQRLGETSALGVVTGWVFGVRWSSGCIKNRDLTKYKHWGSNHKIINLWIEERPNYTGCIWLILDQQTTERWKMVWKNHASANLASVTRDPVFFFMTVLIHLPDLPIVLSGLGMGQSSIKLFFCGRKGMISIEQLYILVSLLGFGSV
jgi:hypothetical protein